MEQTETSPNATFVDAGVEERVRRADAPALADTIADTLDSADLAFGETLASGDLSPGDTIASPPPRHVPSGARVSAAGAGDAITYCKTVLPTVSQAPGGPGVWLAQTERERYQERDLLGAGGMGEVIAVTDHDIGRDVAMKRLRQGVGGDSGLARFVEEVRTVGRLEHPNIVPIHDVGVDSSGRFFFIMKKIDGEPLDAVISRLQAGDPDAHARYGFERRARVILDILDAVDFAHARGIIHRDIKPANVMIGRHGEVVLMDWGLAKEVGKADIEVTLEGDEHADVAESQRVKLTHRGDLLGTPAYMSPEQARGEVERVDERSDIYALGVVFYELMTLEHYLGDQPSVISTLRGVSEHTPTFPALVTSPHQRPVPAEFCHVINHAMAKDPAARYASAAAMSAAIQAALDGDFAVECHVTFVKHMSHKLNRAADLMPHYATQLKVGVALLALMLAGCAYALWRLLT
jgi:serine/threonine-protein kinase